MARRKGRVKDKWREKKWIKVLAPDAFHNVQIAYVPITDEKNAVGRVIESTIFELEGDDPSQHQFKVYFQIAKVQDGVATTIFKRFEYSKEFLRSLVRRGSSKINYILDAKTKDGNIFRLKVTILTIKQLNTSRQNALRLEVKKVLEKTIPEMGIKEFVQKACHLSFESDIMAAGKKLTKLRYAGIEKIKLVRTADKEVTLLQA